MARNYVGGSPRYPAEQPAKVALIINARTASALGIAIPQSLAIAADEIGR